jgi:hypothetical protein
MIHACRIPGTHPLYCREVRAGSDARAPAALLNIQSLSKRHQLNAWRKSFNDNLIREFLGESFWVIYVIILLSRKGGVRIKHVVISWKIISCWNKKKIRFLSPVKHKYVITNKEVSPQIDHPSHIMCTFLVCFNECVCACCVCCVCLCVVYNFSFEDPCENKRSKGSAELTNWEAYKCKYMRAHRNTRTRRTHTSRAVGWVGLYGFSFCLGKGPFHCDASQGWRRFCPRPSS